MIDVLKNLPDIKIRIIKKGIIIDTKINEISKNKKIIIFGVPGAFTSTCSNKHMPDYIRSYNQLKSKGIDDVFCLSVNDPSVMKSWQENYNDKKIILIADGNADLTKALELDKDYSASYMGIRSKRFSMFVRDKKIMILNIEESGQYKVSAPNYIIKQLESI